MKKSIYFLTILIIFSLSPIHLAAATFSDYLKLFDYPEIKKSITSLEKSEFNRISFINGKPSYPDKIIKLYMVASEINNKKNLKIYMKSFNSLVNQSKKELRKQKYKTLSEYNKAEFLLHYIHKKFLKIVQKGQSAGYNIGMKETFDAGVFNCYKSALVYNGILDYFNYSSSYILVYKHIYSQININRKKIDIETTIPYGFDPYNSGYPENKRVFDNKKIKYRRIPYTNKREIDNVSVLIQIYNNRSNIYSGQVSYPGIYLNRDYNRAAALSIIGSFISNNRYSYINENSLSKILFITNTNLRKNPYTIDYEYKRYTKLLNSKLFKPFSNKYFNYIEISCLNALDETSRRETDKLSNSNINKLIESFKNHINKGKKYIRYNSKIKNSFINNSLYQYIKKIGVIDRTFTVNEIKKHVRNSIKLYHVKSISNHPVANKFKRTMIGNAHIAFINKAIKMQNSRQYKESYKIFSTGIDFFSKEIKEIDSYQMKKMRRYRDYVKKMMNR